MGGQEGNRGYLVQSVIAVLKSLKESDWLTVTIEPKSTNDKVDIEWRGQEGKLIVAQIKSSINNFDKTGIMNTIKELVNDSPDADQYHITLLGSFAAVTTSFFNSFQEKDQDALGKDFEVVYNRKNKITVELLFLHLEALDAWLINSVSEFLSDKGYRLSYQTVKLIAFFLSANFTRFANEGKVVSRTEFESLLLDWLQQEYPDHIKPSMRDPILSFYFGGKIALSSELVMPVDLYDLSELPTISEKLFLLSMEYDSIIAQKLPRRLVSGDDKMRIKLMVSTPSGQQEYGGFNDLLIQRVRKLAKRFLNKDLADDFFFVGNVYKINSASGILTPWYKSKEYRGTSEEVNKQEHLDSFWHELENLDDLYRCYNKLRQYKIVPLVLNNESDMQLNGLELQLHIPYDVKILLAENFPLPDRVANVDWLHSNMDLIDHLLWHSKDSQVKEYNHRGFPPIDTTNMIPTIHSTYDFKIDYLRRRIKWIFDYEVHTDIPGMQVIECSFSTLRPGEKVALPSYLFLKYEGPVGLTYKISCKEKTMVVGNVII